jgi:hypothetical protein
MCPGWFVKEGCAMSVDRSATSVVVQPSAREAFTSRELADAYKDFEKQGPQYSDAETGVKAAAYQYGERVLVVYEESEAGVVILITQSRRRGVLQRRREYTTRSRSGQPLRTGAPGAEHRARARRSAGPISNAYARFLELPVPVVLVMLWLIGVVLLGTVFVAAYSLMVWLWAAMELL